MFEGLPCRMLIGWFLILWGLTFFFSAIWGLIDLGGYSPGYLIIEVLWDLTELAIAGILGILGFKVLRGECLGSQAPIA
jgi:hypothetical protein